MPSTRLRLAPGAARPLGLALAGAIALAGAPRPGRADLVAGNLGRSGAGYSSTTGYNVTGLRSAYGQSFTIAIRFRPATGGGTVRLDSVTVPLMARSGTRAVTLAVVLDRDDTPTGPTLERLSLAGVGAAPGLLVARSLSRPTLQPGRSYWLVASPGDETTDIGWMATSDHQLGHSAHRQETASGPAAWTTGVGHPDAAFVVLGSTIDGELAGTASRSPAPERVDPTPAPVAPGIGTTARPPTGPPAGRLTGTAAEGPRRRPDPADPGAPARRDGGTRPG